MKEVGMPFLSFFLFPPSIHPTNDRVALKTNNLETIVALKRLSPSLSLSLCRIVHAFTRSSPRSRMGQQASKHAANERAGAAAAGAAARGISFSIIRRNRRKEEEGKDGEREGGREGGRRKGWSAHYVVGGRWMRWEGGGREEWGER